MKPEVINVNRNFISGSSNTGVKFRGDEKLVHFQSQSIFIIDEVKPEVMTINLAFVINFFRIPSK